MSEREDPGGLRGPEEPWAYGPAGAAAEARVTTKGMAGEGAVAYGQVAEEQVGGPASVDQPESPFRRAQLQPPPQAAMPPPPPQRSGRPWVPWVAGGCLGCLGAPTAFLLLLMFLCAIVGAARPTFPGVRRVAIVFIEGPIIGGRGGATLFGVGGGADRIVRQLVSARRDRSIGAVVLRINSPGGSGAAAQEIHEEVMRLRRSGRPVVASLGDVAASGGYYVASAANKIVANGSTLTGSIGVIMEMENFQGLFRKLGVNVQSIKSGRFKDTGSFWRPLTPEDRRLLQGVVDDAYEQFLDAIAAGRPHVPRAQLRRLADGRVLTGRQAYRAHLVDALGNLQDAVMIAARDAGIRGRPIVVEPGRRGFLDLLMEGEPGVPSEVRFPADPQGQGGLLRLLRRLAERQAMPW